jgi:hypothetical protein
VRCFSASSENAGDAVTPLRTTFDPTVHAAYVTLREIGAEKVARTEAWLHCDIHLDSGGQWLGFDVCPRSGLDLGEAARVRFCDASVAHSFPWNQVNVDLDARGRVLGFELLFDRTMGMPARLAHVKGPGSDPASSPAS